MNIKPAILIERPVPAHSKRNPVKWTFARTLFISTLVVLFLASSALAQTVAVGNSPAQSQKIFHDIAGRQQCDSWVSSPDLSGNLPRARDTHLTTHFARHFLSSKFSLF